MVRPGANCSRLRVRCNRTRYRLRDSASSGRLPGNRNPWNRRERPLFFLNEKWVANGSRGLYRIPKFLGEWVTPDRYDYLYLVVVLVVLGMLFLAVQRAIRSPWGRVLRAIREDEIAAEASGKNVFNFKLQSFVLGAMIMGMAAPCSPTT